MPFNNSPVWAIHVFDPSPLDWLYVLFHTMGEAVRTDHLVGSNQRQRRKYDGWMKNASGQFEERDKFSL
ncbi:hypothetical protein [Bacillus sp. MRMR6]|uniref:hypothetical protein n=1 Tax=Bacillus sp. MRMR6 TaxID=1928617 RepID=UPI001115398A|nr:hypothetical protein [Bacillus sp. MRMR6]